MMPPIAQNGAAPPQMNSPEPMTAPMTPPSALDMAQTPQNHPKKASGDASAPIMRVDRLYMNEMELKLAEVALYQMAEMVNAIGRGGAIYGQLILPPNEAQMKLAASQGGQ